MSGANTQSLTPSQCGSAVSKWIPAVLLAAVLLQTAVIVHLSMDTDRNTNSGPGLVPAPDSGDCSAHGHGHRIQKRATTTGAPLCPPGCVRRRIRTTTPSTAYTPRAPEAPSPRWTAASYDYGYGYQYGSGSQGIRGPSGARGAPGLPGQRGNSGAPGLSGLPGAVGQRGGPGGRGTPGASERSGARGAPGGHGSPGGRGSPGEAGPPGPRGPPGVQGVPGGSGSRPSSNRPQQDSNWPSPRGDQVIRGAEADDEEDGEATRKKQLAQVLNDLRLYDHPACVNAFDHEQVVGKLRDEGKASFMIMVDLAKSVYCIVHA